MYPKTPEMTREQRENLIKLLKTIGSGGKGCRSGPKEPVYMPIHQLSFIEEQEMPRPEIIATNVVLEVENNDASHIPSLGKDQKRGCNK